MILSGALQPGARISQVQLATGLGVSRTPLREALRMLQEEGLVVAKRHHQAQVAELNVEDLEAVYMHRILLESLAVSLTVQTMTAERLDSIEESLSAMKALDNGDGEAWEVEHKRFHELLIVGAPQQAQQVIRRLQDRATSYRRLYTRVLSGAIGRRAVGMREHEQVVAACRARDATVAAATLAQHLGRTALTLMTEVVPEHEPLVVRTSLQLVVHSDLRLSALQRLPINGFDAETRQ
jgi:DNA-binding GntR family transcriptional regulator